MRLQKELAGSSREGTGGTDVEEDPRDWVDPEVCRQRMGKGLAKYPSLWGDPRS